MKLKDKVIVVTGGAGLIGAAFCRAISAEGGIVVIADVDVDSAQNISDLIPNSTAIQLDINSKSSIEAVIVNLHKKYKKIDAVVNNAYPRNKNYGKHFFDVTYEDFCENLNINLGGYFLTSQLFAKFFKQQNYGNIINISSIYGVIPPRFDIYVDTKMTMPVEYAVIKSGLIHLTKYMASYFKSDKIRVNSISPGGVANGQPESFLKKYANYCNSKGMLDPQDLVGALIFLLSDDSKYIHGQNIIIDDGFTL